MMSGFSFRIPNPESVRFAFMPVFISSLNSGSNGNCYYVGNDQDAVLIDAGISCRETERRMKQQGLDMSRLRAIFITHEHVDHISGIKSISKKYKLPVYATAGTFKTSNLDVDGGIMTTIQAFETIRIGDLAVTGFPKQHDASDPLSFFISCAGINIGVITDVGTACEDVVRHFKECHAVFLETNYDEKLLDEGPYPLHLKKRIRSRVGHLSNHDALNMFLEHRAPFLGYLLLSHLSEQNNSPELVEELFSKYAGNTKIVIAPRSRASGVFCIESDVLNHFVSQKKQAPAFFVQGKLF